MELIKIRGNSYFIQAPTSLGVYTFKNKNCLIIDTGTNNTSAKKLEEALLQNNLHPKYIFNTHSHGDHCGGNNYLIERYPGIITYASLKESLFMENIELMPYVQFNSYPSKELKKMNKPIKVDYIPEYGINKINDEKLEVIAVPGHSIEQAALITPDKVCYLGDAVFSESTLNKYPLPYYYNIQESLETLNNIKEIDCDYFVVSHGDKLYDKDEIVQLCSMNINNIHKFLKEILELLSQPLTREELLESISILYNFEMNYHEYHINLAAVSAFISYLYNSLEITFAMENGKLYYFAEDKK
ncbi:MBL fold metallo-hydrolase [Clostridium polynesiense]|uniref:MBL fold metallo-hydrolase n=1 Tax=Clostridium polynesiense TaxID=1325933 RepID=UPI00058AC8AC|nr:MBL fold metallo-hydrolase [Clostridium polynesiense]